MKSLRGFGRAVLAATLVLLLFLSTLAAGSPGLHKKLHSDHGSPTHACLASTIESGHGEGSADASVIFTPPVIIIRAHVPAAVAPASIHSRVFSGRGPPCLS